MTPTSVASTKTWLESDDSILLEPQSGNFCYSQIGSQNSTSATTEFHDQNPSYICEVDCNEDVTRSSADDPGTDFTHFFERPVIIKTYDWAVGASVDDLISPWGLWLRNPRVANRMSNFRGFRGNLHVKFLINGNSFYWGKVLASYNPMVDALRDVHTTIPNNIASLMPASTRPHVWLDPTTSQGGELVLPFFCQTDSLNLMDTVAWDNLGQLWLSSIGFLEHANSLTIPVRIQVLAWATNVTLSGPTQSNLAGLTPQSGVVDDEYGTGPISRPANIVAAAAGMLNGIPTIRPFAMATQMAAGAIGSWASRIGFSRPRNLAVTAPMRINQNGDIATTDQQETCSSLALTSKTEVSVDPRLCGLGMQDELSFEYLCKKPALLTYFDWNLNSGVNHILFSTPVTPAISTSCVIAASSVGQALPPTAFCGLPFKYWRGSMTYRFQLAASSYHKGRLLVVWDSVTGHSTPELNTVNSKIVDISETRDFSVTVGWGQNTASLLQRSPVGVVTNPWTLGSPASGIQSVDNGVLTIYVLNDLVTSGANSSPIRIFVHVSSDDVEFYGPDANRYSASTFEPQSGVIFEPQSGVLPDTDVDIADAPEEAPSVGDMGNMAILDKALLFLAGEKVNSFRTLLKRYGLRRRLQGQFTIPAGDSCTVTAGSNNYPVSRGLNSAPEPVPMTIMGLIAPTFAGWRGSTRLKYFHRGELPSCAYIVRAPVPNAPFAARTNGADSGDLLSNAITSNGAQYSSIVAGQVLDVEIPYYSNWRFMATKIYYDDISSGMGTRLMYTTANSESTPKSIYLDVDELQAIGEDFNLFFWTGAPPIWPKAFANYV